MYIENFEKLGGCMEVGDVYKIKECSIIFLGLDFLYHFTFWNNNVSAELAKALSISSFSFSL